MTFRWAAVVAAALALCPAAARAQGVSVAFVAPERYTDAENRYGSGLPLRATLAELRRAFVELGTRALGPGQSLAIEVLDVDLAGLDAPGLSAPYGGPRVVTDVTPPRLRLAYVLRENGRVALRAQETVTEINYLVRYARTGSSRTLYYERELIRDWLQARITLRRPPPG